MGSFSIRAPAESGAVQRGLFPLFGILSEVGLCGLLYEWPLPETRQGHQPFLGAQLRGVRPYLGIRQVPREAVERGHTCLLGAGTSDEAGLPARVCVGPRGEGSHQRLVLLGPWGESWSKETRHWPPGDSGRRGPSPTASTEHLLAPEKLSPDVQTCQERKAAFQPTDRGASRSSEEAGVSSDAP